MAGNVTKHVTLMSELSNRVEERSLLQLSEIEQELANNHNHSEQSEAIKGLLSDPKIKPEDLLRLVMLYALRYEGTQNLTSNFANQLASLGLDKEQINKIDLLLRYAGNSQRTGDLFNSKNIFKRGIVSLTRGVKGVENIYTEHKPLLKGILDQLLTNKLKLEEYPFLTGSPTRESPQDIIVFMVGGVTFEEALTVHQFNVAGNGVRIILGGSTIHNSTSFLKDIGALKDRV